jgi:peptidoglycan-associated lipoprotein
MKRSTLTYVLLISVLLAATLPLSGCRTTSPKKWWEFWKRSPASTFPVDNEVLPPAPEAGPLGAPGNLAEATPDRSATLSEAPELQNILFEYDSYVVSPTMQKRLEDNAAWIRGHANVTVQIQGHCDERGSTEYNLALGQKRADAVREILVGMGVDPSRLVTISYGKERPLDPEHNEAAWSQNRRAQFLVY